ncbi:hypothetical protein [Streptomyces sp. NPDC048659]|uniref:hypothetical protein n=1 Tax=Streptomyces sp. NPDC048659 TaxID=3155489 RepID=UPI0034331F58
MTGFSADAAIDCEWTGDKVTIRDVQEKARQFFNLELTNEEAASALATRLEKRGYPVHPETRSPDA